MKNMEENKYERLYGVEMAGPSDAKSPINKLNKFHFPN